MCLSVTLFLLATLATAWIAPAGAAAADSLAVVVDVSGSMNRYGPWQPDAKKAIAAILAGNLPQDGRWQADVSAQANLSAYAIGGDGRVLLLPFGSVRADAARPYFAGKSLTPSELDGEFPAKASDFTQDRTNNALAEAAAIHLVGQHITNVPVVMVSDFLADATPSPDQLAFQSDIAKRYSKLTDATLSWARNPRVQIRLLLFKPRESSVEAKGPTGPPGSLRLIPPRYDSRGRNLFLAWAYDGPIAPEKFDVVVRSESRGTMLFTKRDIAGNSVTYQRAAPGRMKWSVTAVMPDGRPIEQADMYDVPGGGFPWGIAVSLAVAVAAVVGGAVLLKKHGPPQILARFRPRPRTGF